MSATLDDLARNMRESLKPQAERLLAEVRALQPKDTGALTATASALPRKLLRRTLRCRLGLHRWDSRTTEPDGFIVFTYRACTSCGKRAWS